MPERKTTDHISYSWLIVVVATLSLVVSNGLAIGGLPPFYKPIREEFVRIGAVDLTHAETFIANCANITFLMSGVFSLIGGWLTTRVNLKTLMLVGCALLGSGLLLHSQAETAAAVYAARFLMGASLGFIGVAPCVVLVSGWFNEKRGTALGIVLTGTSLGGFLIPLAAAPMIATYGWRTAMLAISALVWLVLLPAIIFLVRDPTCRSPHVSKGVTLNAGTRAAATDGFSAAIRNPLFWVFALCAALVFYPIFATSQQFILYLQTPKIGVSAETAAFAQSALFAVSIAGKFLAGALSDKFRAVRVIVACSLLMFLASLVLLDLTAANSLLFLLPFALGYGGTFVLLQRLAADFFGRYEIGKILGLITLIEVTGAAIGGRITGHLADQNNGDYTQAFYGVTIAAALAFLTTLAISALAKDHNIPAFTEGETDSGPT
jgi:sugar phosphate permease